MLDAHKRSVVARALSIAYTTYRARSIREFCAREKVFVKKEPDCDAMGFYDGEYLPRRPALRDKYRYRIRLDPAVGRADRYMTFWHEAGHHIVGKLRLFSYRVGYHQYLYEFTHDHWEHERLVEAFATAMMLYRSGIEPDLADREAFFFADESSLTYGQLMRFSANRLSGYCQRARAKGTNLDLAGLEELAERRRLRAEGSGVQPDLPMDYEDVHREPTEMRYHWVGWSEYLNHNEQLHKGKESWRERLPDEMRLVQKANVLKDSLDHPQLVLFEERAQIDQGEFEKRRRRFERAVKKYTTS